MNPLTRLDVFYSFCLITDLLTATLLHTIIRTFIKNKPEGSKTVIAKIYTSCSYFCQALMTLLCPVILYRILVGTISLECLILTKIFVSGCFNSTIFLFAVANIIKIFFVMDYGRMSTVTEGSVMILSYILTGFFIVGGFLLEHIVVGQLEDMPLTVYLGDEQSRGKILTFTSFNNFSVVLLIISFLMLFIFQLVR